MLSITTTIDEIDALIKNMEFLSPQHNERARFDKLEDLKSLMQNKQLMELIKDTSGKDWQNDTELLIKKIDKKHKILQFTDVYINSLRSLLIFKAMNDVTSESIIELTKEFGQWTFNARYQGEDYVVKWVDIKVNKYFSKTDLPKKFLDLMNGKPTFEITKEWVLNNQDFFFNPNIFNDYNILLKEFIEKIEKNEKLEELEVVKHIPQENESLNESSSITTSANEEFIETKIKTISESSSVVSKKMIQVGVDIAGDPIMEEVKESIEVKKQEVSLAVEINTLVDEKKINEVSEAINENINLAPWSKTQSEDNKTSNIPVVNATITTTNTSGVSSGVLPWEDDPAEEKKTDNKVNTPSAPIEIKEEIKPIDKPKFTKPGSSFAKPGSSFQKPGSNFKKENVVVIGSSDNEDDDAYNFYDDYEEREYISQDDSDGDNGNTSEWSKVKDSELFSELEVSVKSVKEKAPQPVAVNDLPEIDNGIDFESVLEENQKIQSLFKEETEEKQEELKEISSQPRLFENGMTYNSEKAKELETQKQNDILKIEESIKQREEETKEKLKNSSFGKNSIFMSMKKKEIKVDVENEEKTNVNE